MHQTVETTDYDDLLTTGMHVQKVGGSFQHTGVIVADFFTTLGQRRMIVEFDPPVAGMLHIYRPDQLVRA